MNDDTDLMAMWEGVDIVVLTETWLTEDRAHWLRVPGFRFHFSHARQLSSRGARSGGVAVGVKSCLANLVKVEHIDAFPYMVWLNVHKSLIMGAMRDAGLRVLFTPGRLTSLHSALRSALSKAYGDAERKAGGATPGHHW